MNRLNESLSFRARFRFLEDEMRVFAFEFRELDGIIHVKFSNVVSLVDAAFEDEVQSMWVGVAVGIEPSDDDLVDGCLEYLPLELIDFLVPEDGFLEGFVALLLHRKAYSLHFAFLVHEGNLGVNHGHFSFLLVRRAEETQP